MKEEVKEIRVNIDAIAKKVRVLPVSPMINKCHTSLLLGKAWLGKVLGNLGAETPYKNDGKRKTVNDIEPTSDVATSYTIPSLSQVELIDHLREEIKGQVNAIIMLPLAEANVGTMNVDNAITHLSEARFWLGFELESIRKAKDLNEE